MSVPTKAIIATLQSHAAASGHFESVNGHEVKNAVSGGGLVCALWVASITGTLTSSLAATSTRLTISVRVYTSLNQPDADWIEPAVMDAVDALMTAYSERFTLGGLARNVVLLPDQSGEGMNAQAGYLQIGQTMHRIMDLHVPMILNDSFAQGA